MTGAYFEPSEVGPVMTVSVGGEALGISIDQVDRITLVTDVTPVPETVPEHLGLIAHDEAFVPLLALQPRAPRAEEMVVIVQVRGEPVGLSIDEAGRIHRSWSFAEQGAAAATVPVHGARPALADGHPFWWVDTDRLFAEA